MKKLVPIIEFIKSLKDKDTYPERWQELVEDYADFLSQELELWMFVPCDEDGNVLEEPKRWNDFLQFPESFDGNKEWGELYEYQRAKERVLFEGFEYRDGYLIKEMNCLNLKIHNTIEDLVKYNPELTPTAQKQLRWI